MNECHNKKWTIPYSNAAYFRLGFGEELFFASWAGAFLRIEDLARVYKAHGPPGHVIRMRGEVVSRRAHCNLIVWGCNRVQILCRWSLSWASRARFIRAKNASFISQFYNDIKKVVFRRLEPKVGILDTGRRDPVSRYRIFEVFRVCDLIDDQMGTETGSVRLHRQLRSVKWTKMRIFLQGV